MSRTYALKRLLEHGPLTWRECCAIMGGKSRSVRSALDRLIDYGIVRPTNIDGVRHYVLS